MDDRIRGGPLFVFRGARANGLRDEELEDRRGSAERLAECACGVRERACRLCQRFYDVARGFIENERCAASGGLLQSARSASAFGECARAVGFRKRATGTRAEPRANDEQTAASGVD